MGSIWTASVGLLCALLWIQAFLPGAQCLNPIVVKGNLLYDSVTKQRFFARGITYDPTPYAWPGDSGCDAGASVVGVGQSTDVLADDFCCSALWGGDWRADLEDMAHNLHLNTVRVYSIDPSKTHHQFMAKAEALGLYVVVPLTGTDWGFLDATRPSPECYSSVVPGYGNVGSAVLLNAKRVVSEFSRYSNTLLFTVGNEVVLGGMATSTDYSSVPCLKALVRDVHRFQTFCGSQMRRVPLLYAAMDLGSTKRKLLADYLTCDLEAAADNEQGSGEDDSANQVNLIVDAAVDVFGLNTYSWCEAGLALNDSAYRGIAADFKSYGVPVLLSEFGCNVGTFDVTGTMGGSFAACPWAGEGQGRDFSQVQWIAAYGNGDSGGGGGLAATLSGGLAFEYSMHANGYGVVLGPGFSPTLDQDQDQQQTAAGGGGGGGAGGKRVWTTAAHNLASAYGSLLSNGFLPTAAAANATRVPFEEAIAAYPNSEGLWGDADRCTWVPSDDSHGGGMSSRQRRPSCPSREAVDALFASTSQAVGNNWFDPLPPTPPPFDDFQNGDDLVQAERLVASCPDSGLTLLELEENACFGFYDSPSAKPSAAPTRAPTHAPNLPTVPSGPTAPPTREDDKRGGGGGADVSLALGFAGSIAVVSVLLVLVCGFVLVTCHASSSQRGDWESARLEEVWGRHQSNPGPAASSPSSTFAAKSARKPTSTSSSDACSGDGGGDGDDDDDYYSRHPEMLTAAAAAEMWQAKKRKAKEREMEHVATTTAAAAAAVRWEEEEEEEEEEETKVCALGDGEEAGGSGDLESNHGRGSQAGDDDKSQLSTGSGGGRGGSLFAVASPLHPRQSFSTARGFNTAASLLPAVTAPAAAATRRGSFDGGGLRSSDGGDRRGSGSGADLRRSEGAWRSEWLGIGGDKDRGGEFEMAAPPSFQDFSSSTAASVAVNPKTSSNGNNGCGSAGALNDLLSPDLDESDANRDSLQGGGGAHLPVPSPTLPRPSIEARYEANSTSEDCGREIRASASEYTEVSL